MIEVFSSNNAVAIFIPGHADFSKDVWKCFARENAILNYCFFHFKTLIPHGRC
jgi:hypothetical protein